ncbi:MAG: hypothetical protein CFH01_00456 [Alphaproteobacteria bacterium MarineAlpha2_Bin1]|nr:MAG: hypothetical protein CFH01_00456 [Alphaproteobacteria bacterium MarineAlpha2_Bin1]|tara:strand:- start:479 stop:1156 length:678 start_codon:yes stop_codon:yes gene_type:complete
MSDNSIIKNLNIIYEDIKSVSKSINKLENNVKLQIVSKQQKEENIELLIKYGHSLFGENKVQEAKLKWGRLKKKYPKTKLHFIGSLQTNKVKDAIQIFDTIESLDKYKLAEKIDYYEKKMSKKLEHYIQVKTGIEDQKGGINIEECEDFFNKCKKNLSLNITGLMCIPPIDEESSLHFALINNLAEKLQLQNKSMGMSSDYKVAIEFGSTQIRLGQRVFGPRSKN